MIDIIAYLDRAPSYDSNDIWKGARRCVMAELEGDKKIFRSKILTEKCPVWISGNLDRGVIASMGFYSTKSESSKTVLSPSGF